MHQFDRRFLTDHSFDSWLTHKKTQAQVLELAFLFQPVHLSNIPINNRKASQVTSRI